MLVIRGRSSIAYCLRELVEPQYQKVGALERGELPHGPVDRLFVSQGIMTHETGEALEVNCLQIARLCDHVLRYNPQARICVMGSESAYLGSHSEAYSISKAALHRYVECARLSPGQQLVAISPGIISDAQMTKQRADQDTVAERARTHPKGRHVTSAEVAALAYFLLFLDKGYISNTVVRMHGGRT